MRAAFAAVVAAGLAPTLPAARAQAPLRDDRGVIVALPHAPARIVSLVPSITESVCALGACGRLVGTDRFSNWPASVRALPKLGGLDDAQIERIAALKPDVVFVSASARVIDRLAALGIPVAVLESRSHAEVQHSLVVLAAMLGTPARADAVWAGIERATLDAGARVPATLRGQRVYFEVDPTPYAAGAGSFIGETLSTLGLANTVPAALGPFPKLNPEFVLRAQPDIVMGARRAIEEMPRRPGWASLRALQSRRVCAFDADRYELLVRPGPRMGEAAAAITDCLVAIAARPQVVRAVVRDVSQP